MPLSQFTFSYLGNILNLIFTLLLISGIILYTVLSKYGFSKAMLVSFTIFLNLILFAALISTKIKMPLPDVYVFDHPLAKVFSGILFVLYQFFQFFFISVIWLNVISKELVLLRAVVYTFTFAVFLFMLTFIFINFNKTRDQIKPYTGNKYVVAVVLGAAVWPHNAPSPSLAARIDKAVSLYKKKLVNKIQLTGSNAPGELSEAEVAYNYIKNQKVNMNDVWMEKNTVSTSEQIRFIRGHLFRKKNIGKIIIVSDSYHLTRVKEMCGFFKIKAGLAASELKFSFDNNLYYEAKESIALIIFWLFGL